MQASQPIPMDSESPETQLTVGPVTMDIHRVLSMLPHRYPFLLIDRVLDFKRRRLSGGAQERLL